MKRIHIFVLLTLAFGGRRLYSHEFSSGQQVPDYASGIGLFAKSGQLHVVCTDGFYRYDNVRITCAKYGVPVYASLTEAIGEIIR